MKRKWILCIYVLVQLVSLKQTFHYIYNEWVILKYNRQDYSANVDVLLTFNIFQPYIAHYNNGNIYYQEEDYDKAIEEYSKALKKHPPKYKECSIRINLALAMLQNLEAEEDAVTVLNEARDVLLEEDCATEEGDGHSDTAEKLKEEIENLLRELEQQSQTSEEPEEEQKKNEEQQETELEKSIREQLQGKQSEAYQEREAELQFFGEFDLDFNFDYDYDDPIW